MSRLELIACAESFVSFILKNKQLEKYAIKEIILFGSLARGDFDEKSDIDIFINIREEKEIINIKKIIDREIKKFYKSKFFEVWELRKIKNEINVKVGVLDKWNLKRSIISDGLVLYGKYNYMPKKIGHYSLFVFEPIKNVTKRNRVIRELFGRLEKNYKSKGILRKLDFVALTQRSFIVPIQNGNKIINLFKKEKVNYKSYELWSDQFNF